MGSLGLFLPGCAPSSQIEISESSLVETHLQHRLSNLGCLRGVSSDQARIYIMGHRAMVPRWPNFLHVLHYHIHCFSGPMSWSDILSNVEWLKCQQHACHQLLNITRLGLPTSFIHNLFPGFIQLFCIFHTCIRPTARALNAIQHEN